MGPGGGPGRGPAGACGGGMSGGGGSGGGTAACCCCCSLALNMICKEYVRLSGSLQGGGNEADCN